MNKIKTGYYKVLVASPVDGAKVPYVVFAMSDFQAARIVKAETGHFALEGDVAGPFATQEIDSVMRA